MGEIGSTSSVNEDGSVYVAVAGRHERHRAIFPHIDQHVFHGCCSWTFALSKHRHSSMPKCSKHKKSWPWLNAKESYRQTIVTKGLDSDGNMQQQQHGNTMSADVGAWLLSNTCS